MNTMREECIKILQEAEKQKVLLRVIGGMAVNLHCPQASIQSALKREYGDLDFVTASPDDQRMRDFFKSIDYTPNSRFNALRGASRMMFYSPDETWYIDIFINEFHMCHNLKFERTRLQQDPLTIPLADLLLTKMQIVEINAKDVRDIAALLIEHPLGHQDQETINLDRILEITTYDWGFYTTVRMNVDKLPGMLEEIHLPEKDTALIKTRLADLATAMDDAPKSRGWRIRAVIGKSKQWYEEPEEAAREEMKLE